MKGIIQAFFSLLISIHVNCQSIKSDSRANYNLDFEIIEKGNLKEWNNSGGEKYIFSLDSTIIKNGKYAAIIQSKAKNPDFGYLTYTIPHSFSGKKITLSGYIKTENVKNGSAGLWIRIDPAIAYADMSKNGIKGTKDWAKYEISMDLNPEKTTQILVGGMLIGEGKMWLDGLQVSVDKKDIVGLKPYTRKEFPAEKDTLFNNGSLITSIIVNKNQIENLKTLGLIWGFVKYYHPNIAKGEYNWDYELFRVLPKILKSENKDNIDEILVQWIKSFGQFPASKKPFTISNETKIAPDLNWISDSGFSKELTSLLLKIKNAERSKEHFYIGIHNGFGNPEFKNEDPYWSMQPSDVGYRMLALYRYWNIIQYYFPYKNLIEEDWKKVMEEFIPRFIDANNETDYTFTALELICRVHDTHANIWGNYPALHNYFGSNYAAAELTFIENAAVVTGFNNERFGKETGLEIGDKVTAINNQPISEIVKSRLKYYPASNYPTKLRDIAPNLLRTNESSIQIEFARNNKLENRVLNTYAPKELTIKNQFAVTDTSFKIINDEIAYINNSSLKKDHLVKIWKEIENTKGLIIDNRNYPSDFILYDLCNYLMPISTPFVKFSNGSIKEPGLFTFTKHSTVGKDNKRFYKGKVVILVNEISQSSSEFHTMAYRVHPNAIVIGSTTAGADGSISQFYLPGGINTVISGIGVYYPDGKETQRIGIIPDIEIKPTIQGIKNRQDELLQKAIELINK